MRIELTASTPEDTMAVGEAVASLIREGDAVALTGELGAGKTTFVRGAARALGFDGAVASPTFTLVREYQGRVRIYHVDVYRLERVQDVLDLGLDEMAALRSDFQEIKRALTEMPEPVEEQLGLF